MGYEHPIHLRRHSYLPDAGSPCTVPPSATGATRWRARASRPGPRLWPTLSRRALSGVARALDQGRLEEAKALGTLAASLACIPERPADRVDGDDVVEALLDEDKALLLVAADDGEPLHPARARYLRAVLDEGMELGKGPLKAAQVRAARTMLDLGQALGEAGLPTWATPSGTMAELERQAEGDVEDEEADGWSPFA